MNKPPLILGVDFETIEARVLANLDNKRDVQRDMEKALVFGARYGMGTVTGRWSGRGHPLQWSTAFKHLGQDKRFNNCHLYKTNTKVMGKLLYDAEDVPACTMMYCTRTQPEPYGELSILLWKRAQGVEEVKLALAALTMMNKENVCIVRAFDPA